MADEQHSTDDLLSIAIFPLNVVLFPGMRLPLHIFEERYRLMLSRCLNENLQFGITLIESGAEVGEPAVPFEVGTLARLHDVTRLPDGRYYLIAEGTERFRLDQLTQREPYLEGLVRRLPETSPPAADLADVIENLTRLFRQFWVQYLTAAGRQPADLPLPDDPRLLSYQIAAALPIDRREKQQLLEFESVEERLREEIAILRNQTQALERLLRERGPRSEQAAPRYRFSIN